MTAALVLSKDVNLTDKLGVGMNGAGLSKNLAALDIGSLNTAKKSADVVAGLSVIEGLAEHLDSGADGLALLFLKTNDLKLVAGSQLSTLNSTGGNSTTAGDGEDILNRHKERQVSLTVGSGDISVNSVHELPDASKLGGVRIIAVVLKSLKSRTLDDRGVIAGEAILVKSIADLHLDKLKELRIVDLVNLVHEDDDIGHANLAGKKKVLLGLSHGAVGSSYNKDSAVHLSSTGDHVLDIVSMAGAVNMSIVTGSSLILNVSGVDCNTALSLLGSLIDVSVINKLSLALHSESLGDSSGKSSLTMVNVTNGTNVYMGLSSFEFSFCHLEFPPFNWLNNCLMHQHKTILSIYT